MIYDYGKKVWLADCAPGADLDYGFDWATQEWLEPGEYIVESSWSAPPSVVLTRPQILADTRTSTFARIDLAGYSGRITNTITTSDGRTDSRSILLSCKRR